MAGKTNPDIARWKALAEKELRGKPVDSLDRRTPEGIAIKPLYTAADLDAIEAALVALTICAGGFTAGLHAGLTYNTFPLMDGHLVPAGYAPLHPFWRNWFENIAAVQFDHRLLAETTFAVIALMWFAGGRAALPRRARTAQHALLAAVLLQFALGVSTLLLVVPIPFAAAHQAGAVLLLTAALVFRHTLRAPELDLPRTAAI